MEGTSIPQTGTVDHEQNITTEIDKIDKEKEASTSVDKKEEEPTGAENTKKVDTTTSSSDKIKTPEQIALDKKAKEELELKKKTEEDLAEATKEGKKEGEEITKKNEEVKKETPWYKKEEPTTTVKKEETATQEPAKDIQEKVVAYDQLMKDPEIVSFLEAKKAGKNLRSFLKELKGVDPESLSTENLYKISLEAYKLSDEKAEEYMDKFKEMGPVEQANATNAVKEKLLKEQNDRLSKFATESTAEAGKVSERDQQIIDKAKTDIDSLITDITGKTYMGVEVTAEMAEDVRKGLVDDFTIYNADGTYNIPYMAELVFFTKFRQKLMEDNVEAAVTAVKKEMLDENSRVNPEDKGIQRTQDTGTEDKGLKEAEDIAKLHNPTFQLNNA